MNIVAVRDLRANPGELIHFAEAGQVSVVVKRGNPVFVAIPVNEQSLPAILSAIAEIPITDESMEGFDREPVSLHHRCQRPLRKVLRRLNRHRLLAMFHPLSSSAL